MEVSGQLRVPIPTEKVVGWATSCTGRSGEKKIRERNNAFTSLNRHSRGQYQIEITNRFAALVNLSDDEDVERTWENIKENIKTSAKESLGLHEWKQNKPWFDEECLGFWIKGSGLKYSGYRIQAKAR